MRDLAHKENPNIVMAIKVGIFYIEYQEQFTMKNFVYRISFIIIGFSLSVVGYAKWLDDNPHWSYYEWHYHLNDNAYNITFFHMYLGDQVQIAGKTYYELLEETQRESIATKLEEEHGVIGYVREEDGKILAPISSFKEELATEFEYLVVDDEYIIYDPQWDKDCIVSASYYNTMVTDVEQFMLLNGSETKLLTLTTGEKIIDGIGCINKLGGFLYYLSRYNYAPGGPINWCLNVFVRNEVVEYKAPNFTGVPALQETDYTTYKPDPYFGELVETGIISPTYVSQSSYNTYFDISGRRTFNRPKNGIYIKNGKKMR